MVSWKGFMATAFKDIAIDSVAEQAMKKLLDPFRTGVVVPSTFSRAFKTFGPLAEMPRHVLLYHFLPKGIYLMLHCR